MFVLKIRVKFPLLKLFFVIITPVRRLVKEKTSFRRFIFKKSSVKMFIEEWREKMGLLRVNFGRRIKQLRKVKSWTQEELASKANMEYKYLGAIERGEKNLTIDNIEKIAKGFGIEAHQLFLFSIEGLEAKEKVTEGKIKDILKYCDSKTKKVLLNIIQSVLKLRTR